jgi:hypothetical protein
VRQHQSRFGNGDEIRDQNFAYFTEHPYGLVAASITGFPACASINAAET